VRDNGWLACVAGDAGELNRITERALGTYAEISRNRPEGRLPEVRFRSIGSWPLASRPDDLTEALRRTYSGPTVAGSVEA
jgi:hypothetical protein